MLHDIKNRELIQSSKYDSIKAYIVTDCCNNVYYEIEYTLLQHFYSKTLIECLNLFDKLVELSKE